MLVDLESLEFRKCLYALLGFAYYQEPTRQFIQGLAAGELFRSFPIPVNDNGMRQGLDLLSDSLAAASKGIHDKDLEKLQLDYFRMFVGPGIPQAPPWESVYRTEERIMFGSQTMEVRKEYERFGLVVELRNKVPDDHLGLELEFMAHLNSQCQEYMLRDNEQGGMMILQAQREFLDNHLLQWVPRFCQDVYTQAKTNFYAGIAKLTEGFLYWDRDFISMITM